MTQSNEPTVDQKNDVIAKFMDIIPIPAGTKRLEDIKPPEQSIAFLDYHKDWNLLMPVVKKIKNIKGLHPIAGMKAMSELNHGLLWIDIDRIHKGIFIFLTWYNQQTTTNEQSAK